MAAITPAKMVRNSEVVFSPTAFTTTIVTYTFDMPVDDKFFLYVELNSTTSGDDAIFTIAAGTGQKAFQRGLGSLAVTLASTGIKTYRKLIGPLESARFIQSTGNISVALSSSGSGIAGFIGVAKMPYVIYSA